MKPFRCAVWKQDNWFIADCVEIDLATQAGSESEALENMREALALHFDAAEDEIGLEAVADPLPQRSNDLRAAAKTFRQLRFKLESQGFRGISQSPKHAKFIKSAPGAGTSTAILPHYTELAPYVVASIRRQSGIPPED